MASKNFIQSNKDHCLYTKKLSDGSLMVFVLYVDDMLVVKKFNEAIESLKKILLKTFAMKDLSNA